MIKINLLPTVREVKKRETIRQQMAVVIGAVVIELVFIGYLNATINGQIKRTKDNMTKTRNEIKKLEEIIKEVKDIEKRRNELEAKLKVIENLEKGRVASVIILDELSKVIPEKMWITDFKESQNNLSLKGVALNNQTVADFIQNLEKSEIFQNIAFGSSNQVTKEKYKLVEFDISFRAKVPGTEPPEPEKAPGAASPRAPRRGRR